MNTSWKPRKTAVAIFIAAVFALATVQQAFADAADPIPGTMNGTVVINPPGTNGSPAGCTQFGTNGTPFCTVTVYVRGQYAWPTMNDDCNTERAATGLGVIWNDATEPGFTVSKGTLSEGVGIKTLRDGDTVNSIDQMVHPADVGNVAEGYPGLAQQTFNDPTPPGIGTAQYNAWRGGCGRVPLSATASPGPGNAANPSGKTCGDGSTSCANHPWGSWGYQVNNGKGYAHTYAKRSDLNKICVNMYDMHVGGPVGDPHFQLAGGTGDITVNKNDDNSI